jgi:hypothetical protein
MNRLALFAALFAGAVLSQQASATVLFDSIPSTDGASTSARPLSGWTNMSNVFRVYDKFTLGQAATIDSAEFVLWGNYAAGTQADLGIFSVDNGVPGAQLFQQTLSIGTPSALANPSTTITSRVSVAPTSLDLAAGTYFISLVGLGYNSLTIPVFSTVDAANPVATGAYTYQSISGSHYGVAAYRIDGSIDGANVPEPSVLALVGLGAAAAFAARRRKQA